MRFEARDEDNDDLSLTLRSECPGDKVRLVYMLASLKVAAGMEANSPHSGSTNPVKPEPTKVGA